MVEFLAMAAATSSKMLFWANLGEGSNELTGL